MATAVICNFWHPVRPSTERQSAQMSKITNDGCTRSGTGYFIAVPIWQQWASKGKTESRKRHQSATFQQRNNVCYIQSWGWGSSSAGLDWAEPTQYRLYGRRFLQVKRPNQQHQRLKVLKENLRRTNQTTKIHICTENNRHKTGYTQNKHNKSPSLY